MLVGSIIGLGSARLDFALLAIDDDISRFAWDGCEEGVGIFLQIDR